MKQREGFGITGYLFFAAGTLAVCLFCICVGSVNIPLGDIWAVVEGGLAGGETEGISSAIILQLRVPRVLSTALVGAALSISGAAMQGLLRNPLADGTTLGVSSGASLGAVLAIAFGLTIPGIPGGGTMLFAMLFAFLSLMLILLLAYRLDRSLETQTIILVGVIFSMFASSLINLIIAFSSEKIKTIAFWTMGSLAGSNYASLLALAVALVVCGPILLVHGRELNAFALGEDSARNLGISVRRVKLLILIAVSILIGICVSVGGTIGFVGLVIPHMTRMITGPNHRKLLPACLFTGSIFLMLADLVSRTILSPLELPIGVVTSMIGSVAFVIIFDRSKRGR